MHLSRTPAPVTGYALPVRLLHWLMALAFLFMWASGFVMTRLAGEDTPLEELLFGLHISAGVSLIVLLKLRILTRVILAAPRAPAFLTRVELRAMRLVHRALYILPALILLIGWAEVDFGGHGVEWFGIALPKVFPTLDTLYGQDAGALMELWHRWLAYGLLGLVALHVAAVLKHRRVAGQDVLWRMSLPRRPPARPGAAAGKPARRAGPPSTANPSARAE